MSNNIGPARYRLPVRPRLAGVLAASAGLALLVTACSGSGSSASSGGSSPSGESSAFQKALAYAECMRSHGAPNFPDPSSNGVLARDSNDSQSALRAAGNACLSLVPGGQPAQPQQLQQEQTNELKFAQCMRSSGIPNWPDPTNMGGEYEFNLHAVGIDPNTPQAQAAEQICESRLRLSASQVHIPG